MRAMQQRGDHGRIHAAGQPEEDLVVADLRAHAAIWSSMMLAAVHSVWQPQMSDHEAAQQARPAWCG
jgi:hypothetical protein